jgi:hypothetical protein
MAGKGRKINFNINEDLSICRNWCETSEDSIVGNSQKKTTMWDAILEKFNNDMGYTTNVRTKEAIQSRWNLLQQNCNKFHFVLNTTERINQSGANEAYKVNKLNYVFEIIYFCL